MKSMKKYFLVFSIMAVLLLSSCGSEMSEDTTKEMDGQHMGETNMQEMSEDVITLGFIGPLTGEAAEIGQASKNAVELSVEEINNAGGINGKIIEVIYEDGGCDSKSATNAGKKLIEVDNVALIIGGACSGETFAVAPIAETNQKVLLSYCSSAPGISDAGDYVFRIYPSDSYQGKFAAEYAYNELGHKKAGIIYVNNEWGAGLKETFTQRFEELGGEVAALEAFTQGNNDLKTHMTKMQSANVDVVFMPAYAAGTILLLKQAKEQGITAQLLGADGSFDPTVTSEAGTFGEGFKTVLPSAEFDEAKLKEFQERYGDSMPVCTVQAYDAPKLVAQVMNEVGTDSEAIKNVLYDATYQGQSGNIDLDENGDLVGAEYKVMEIQNGEWAKIA